MLRAGSLLVTGIILDYFSQMAGHDPEEMFAAKKRMSVTICPKVADDVGSISITRSISQLAIGLGA